MSKVKIIQTNFTGGELSPAMLGRVDTVKYQNSFAAGQNMLVRQQGGLWFRSGSEYVGTAKDSTRKTRIYEFEYSETQAYILEFGHLYVRVWFNGGFVETAPASGVPLEITTPYTEDEIFELTFTQSADVLYVFHNSHPTQKIRRLGANSWDIVTCDFQDGPYLSQNTPAVLKLTNYTSVAQAVATGAVFTGVSVNRTISAAVVLIDGDYRGTGLELTTSVNHGFSSGNIVAISGVKINYFSGSYGIRYYPQSVTVSGSFIITVTAADKFTLNGYKPPTNIGFDIHPYTTTLTNALAQIPGTSKNFEYKQDNQYKLAEILTITDTTHADVKVFQNIKNDITRAAKITVSGTTMSSSLSGVFTLDDIGKYVKATNGSWYQIINYTTDATVVVTAAIPLLSYDKSVVTITVSEPVITGTITSDTPIFVETDVARHIRFNYGGKRPWGIILHWESTTVVIVSFKAEVPLDPTDVSKLYNEGITELYQLGSWSHTTGFPKAAVFHEQRLWAGGTTTEPLNIWGSQPNDFENNAPTEYDSTVLDTNAINYTLVSNTVNPILWLVSSAVLLVGTDGSEWQVKASSISQPITPSNISVTPQTTNGALPSVRPIRINSAVMFLQKAGRKLIEIVYDFQQDSFVGRNLTVVSDHILRKGGKAVAIAYQKEPNNIVWVVLQDGTIAAMTYEKDQQVVAWHAHTLGGNGLVESVACVSSEEGTEDTLYMVVKRTINGVQKRYIERMTPDFYPANELDKDGMFFVDCGLQYDGAPTTTITGLDHLQNETVSVIADGEYLGEKTIVGTTLTLDNAASVVTVGYKYLGYVRILPLEGPSKSGTTAQGQTKRAGKTMFRVYNTLDFKFGRTLNNLDHKKMVDGNGTPTGKITSDDLIVNIPTPYTYTGMFYVVQDQPLPFVLLAIAPDVEITS